MSKESSSSPAKVTVAPVPPVQEVGKEAAAAALGPIAAAERGAATDTVRRMRRRRAASLIRRIALFVVLPTLLGAAYFAFIASARYESVSMFTVDSSDVRSASPMESLIGLAGASTAMRDTLAVRDFVLSREMLIDLDQTEHFIAHYKDARHDFWSRLRSDASFEKAYEHYQKVVVMSIDPSSSVLTLRVRAYSAERAQAFSRRILARSEKMVNELAERARQDQIAFASREVEKAEKRLGQARQELLEVQQRYGEFNPAETAAAAISIRTALEGEVARARAELAALKSYMADDHPQVIAATERVRSLAAQAAGESKRLVNPKGKSSLSTELMDFEKANMEKEFATGAYQTALASLEVARTNAMRQHRYLATIAAPSLADEAQFPRRWLGTLTIFLASLLFFGIGSLLIASIKEHARL